MDRQSVAAALLVLALVLVACITSWAVARFLSWRSHKRFMEWVANFPRELDSSILLVESIDQYETRNNDREERRL